MIKEVLQERVVSSRGRQVVRGVRQRISQYQTRKAGPTNLVKGLDYRKAVRITC